MILPLCRAEMRRGATFSNLPNKGELHGHEQWVDLARGATRRDRHGRFCRLFLGAACAGDLLDAEVRPGFDWMRPWLLDQPLLGRLDGGDGLEAGDWSAASHGFLRGGPT